VKPALSLLGASMWAVPLLFATSGFLSTLDGRSVDLPRRMRRLLVPYAVWSVVLLAYSAQGAIRAGAALNGLNWLGVVFAGEAFYTLWFLAMLVYVTLVGWALRSDSARLAGAGLAMVAYAALAVVRAGEPVLATDTWSGFLAIAPLCVASYLLGAALPRASWPKGRVAALFVVAAMAAGGAMYVVWGVELTQGQQLAVMLAGSVAALGLLGMLARAGSEARALSGAAWAGRMSLGIYVIHAPVLNIVRYVTHTRDSASFVWALALCLIGIAVALGASYVISLARPLRPLVR